MAGQHDHGTLRAAGDLGHPARVRGRRPVGVSADGNGGWLGRARVAIGETVIVLTLPSPSLLKHLLKGEGVQQNDSLADG